MRRGELAGLQWKSIFLDKDILLIEANLVERTGEAPKLHKPKNGKCRTAFISPQLTELFRSYQQEQINDIGIGQFVFTQNGNFRPIKPGNGNVIFRRYCKGLGIEGAHLHKIRHTHASIMANHGVSLYIIQQALGHADPSVTARFYLHADTAAQQKAALDYQAILYR